jgi:hypothetical protein
VKRSSQDPVAEFQRSSRAARRIGHARQCACGEKRPEALIAGNNPMTCAACKRIETGQKTFDDHHVAGQANSTATISVFVNDHRAILSVAQYDWPPETLENPNGNPLLRASACIRGFADTLYYLIENFLLWIPNFLERLDAFLTEKFGPEWWVGTELEEFKVKK